MFCNNCGSRINDDAKFCSACGLSVEEMLVSNNKEKGTHAFQIKVPVNNKKYNKIVIIFIAIVGIFLLGNNLKLFWQQPMLTVDEYKSFIKQATDTMHQEAWAADEDFYNPAALKIAAENIDALYDQVNRVNPPSEYKDFHKEVLVPMFETIAFFYKYSYEGSISGDETKFEQALKYKEKAFQLEQIETEKYGELDI